MVGIAPAQSLPLGSVIASLGTFLLAAVFYGLTAHVAARYVLGDVSLEQALLVGIAPAAVLVVGIQLFGEGAGLLVSLVLSVVADYLAIDRVYDPGRRWSVAVTAVHYAVSVLLGSALASFLV
ncbi:hypothetical protein SAMN06269185_2258 [Natronoarchaeum philippinense]|uniref:Uncharacterized protein n=1 Tax=Natronoarchaeum philippinense TaxID=558529 RepID=A0A285NZA1_NATPI|nr:hypothetical protein [Natronoarchaeum philippinense]SNZ14795.1 hypothetical protein SAMN06269185_2258 [Natronoarchaeum philippinense]